MSHAATQGQDCTTLRLIYFTKKNAIVIYMTVIPAFSFWEFEKMREQVGGGGPNG